MDHSLDHGGGVDIDVDHGVDSADGPSLFNPLVIASAITAFGAVGLAAMKGFGMSGLLSTIVALAFAGVIGAAIFFGIVRFMYGSQSNSIFSLHDLTDMDAEVLTPIPENGIGEIVCVANGIRYNLSARTVERESIKRGATVVIREIAGNVAVVQRKLTIDDVELFDEEQEAGKAEGENEGRNEERNEERNEKPRRNAGNK